MTDWSVIAARVTGTTDSPPAIAERFDVDEADVEEMLAEHGVETCSVCGWWFLDVNHHPECVCPDCA